MIVSPLIFSAFFIVIQKVVLFNVSSWCATNWQPPHCSKSLLVFF